VSVNPQSDEERIAQLESKLRWIRRQTGRIRDFATSSGCGGLELVADRFDEEIDAILHYEED